MASAKVHPASAGETHKRPRPCARSGVHPRECGGNSAKQRVRSLSSGPSPRVRGKPILSGAPHGHDGSIPASAGETWREPVVRPAGRVHPREWRGKQEQVLRAITIARSIPASAGETTTPGCPEQSSAVHPRECGETALGKSGPLRYTVHPRECGGNSQWRFQHQPACGPSPRVRGKLFQPVFAAPKSRSIPASAGETKPVAHPPGISEVHPASAGETEFWRGIV